MELEIEKDVEATLAKGTNGFRPRAGKKFLAHLDPTGLRIELIDQRQGLIQIRKIERDDNGFKGNGGSLALDTVDRFYRVP